jgi:hypothetical protein
MGHGTLSQRPNVPRRTTIDLKNGFYSEPFFIRQWLYLWFGVAVPTSTIISHLRGAVDVLFSADAAHAGSGYPTLGVPDQRARAAREQKDLQSVRKNRKQENERNERNVLKSKRLKSFIRFFWLAERVFFNLCMLPAQDVRPSPDS